MTEKELTEKAEIVKERDPDFFKALMRARWLSVGSVIGMAVVVLLVIWGTLEDYGQSSDIKDLQPKVEGLTKRLQCDSRGPGLQVLLPSGRIVAVSCVPAAAKRRQKESPEARSRETGTASQTGSHTSPQPSEPPRETPGVGPRKKPKSPETPGGAQIPNPVSPGRSEVCVNNPLLPVCLSLNGLDLSLNQ